jgi:hypothetical protein
MKSLLTTACAATIALGTVAPLQAAPIFVPQAPAAEANIVKVEHTERHERRQARREARRDRREARREARRDRREDRREFRRAVRRGNGWYYNGYRGYSYYRPGYREFDGFWFPLAAFAAGAIIASQPRVVVRGYSSAHVDWCYDRYRSYRAYDNTFQPYHGPRRQCYSPFS